MLTTNSWYVTYSLTFTLVQEVLLRPNNLFCCPLFMHTLLNYIQFFSIRLGLYFIWISMDIFVLKFFRYSSSLSTYFVRCRVLTDLKHFNGYNH